MINLARVVSSPRLAQPFTILRDVGGQRQQGVYVPSAPQTLQALGVITPASDLEVQMLPESDRVSGMILVATATPLQESSSGPPAVNADIIAWKGKQYRVHGLMPLGAYGFNKALCGLMGGG